MKKYNLGGDRLGSGNKMEVNMHGFNRSNHDLSYLWKSTMAPGTLVPFMNIIGLPGDTFEIDLNSVVKTLPTVGPLFGSFKLQLDVFNCPLRLYNAQLHNNALKIGYKIADVKFPIIKATGKIIDINAEEPVEFQQINQSSLLAYLGMRGLGSTEARDFNANSYLAYFDIFKNYYANKQEENAYIIHGSLPSISESQFRGIDQWPISVNAGQMITGTLKVSGNNVNPSIVKITQSWSTPTAGTKDLNLTDIITGPINWLEMNKIFEVQVSFLATPFSVTTFSDPELTNEITLSNVTPNLQSFALENLDRMREELLQQPKALAYIIDQETITPYGLPLMTYDEGNVQMYAKMAQEGLLVKTYQSDIFNNWINTETQELISSLSAVSTVGDSFTLDALNISKKIYDYYNRIMVSGGAFNEWIEASFDVTSKWRSEIPEYHGGLSKEIVFEQITSTAATDGKPLGSLAGQGTMGQKHKGGHIYINCDEPSIIMGIISITPRLDYSQGNDWTVNLKTLDDLHKPNFDGIGFQDLITDQMFFADTYYSLAPAGNVFKSAGKQPAWIWYMTNYNQAYGNFADPRSMMYMTLNRRYEMTNAAWAPTIKDLTTYIDPSKFNYAFAQSDLSSQNFMVQVGVNIFARRKMSSAIMPTL